MDLSYKIHTSGSDWSIANAGESYRFEVRPGDVWSGDPSSKERSEVKVDGVRFTVGTTYTISYKFMIEPGEANDASSVIVGQIHATADAGEEDVSPPIAIKMVGEKLALAVRADTNAQTLTDPQGYFVYTTPEAIVRGQWYDIRLTVALDPFGSGRLDMAIDGQDVVHYVGQLGYNDRIGGYWKHGIYRTADDVTLAANYSDFAIDVVPGGPTPISSGLGYTFVSDLDNGRMIGGDGVDTGLFRTISAGVTVNLNLSGPQDTGGGGIQTLVSIENLTGSNFNDVLAGNAGDNVLIGGGGADTVSYADAARGVTVDLSLAGPQNTVGAGVDTLSGFSILVGSEYGDVLRLGAGRTVRAGGGDDLIYADTGTATYDGGAGADTVSFAFAAKAVTASLDNTASQNTGFGFKTFISIENLEGSAFADKLTGDAGDNVLVGGDGDDILDGGLGADRLDGGAGSDTASFASATSGVSVYLGSEGDHPTVAGSKTFISIENLTGSRFDDVLEGDAGDNILIGGGGSDTVSYAHAARGVTIDFNLTGAQDTVGAGFDTLSGFSTLVGSVHNDILRIGGGTRVVRAGDGDDLLHVDGGTTTYDGGDGADTVSFVYATKSISASLANTASQSTGMGYKIFVSIENLVGGDFDDKLIGDGAANVLVGGLGADRLTGGGGADTFRYNDAAESTLAARDTITDFQTGVDKLDLRGIRRSDADGYTIFNSGNTTYLDVDLGQDGSIDFRLALTGKDALAASDILWVPQPAAPVDKDGEDAIVVDEPAPQPETPNAAPQDAADPPGDSQANPPSGVVEPPLENVGQENAETPATPAPTAPPDVPASPTELIGTDLDDRLTGDDQANLIRGGEGKDALDGAAGDDILHGDDGDDTLIGGAGADTLAGGAGIDTASYAASTSAVTIDLTLSTAQSGGDAAGDILSGIENLIGSAFADTLRGDSTANSLTGGDGDDTIYGGGGLDNILGGNGADRLYAEGSAAAEMRGGDGDDVLNTLGTGGYKLYGGSGLDTFNLTTAVVGLTAEGADGDDVFNVAIGAGSAGLSGGNGADTFVLTSGQVQLNGGAGQDVFRLHASQFSLVGSYNFRITGFETGAGGDKLDLVGAVNGLTSFGGGNPFTTGHMRLLQSGADTLVQVDGDGGANSFATLFTLTGVQASAVTAFNLTGYAPDVATPPTPGITRTGTAGAETLTGTANADVLDGAGGDDTLIGGAGADTLTGGAGIDTASYAASASGVSVNLTLSTAQSGGDAAGDILSGIENLIGSAFADTLRGDASANSLNGGAGDDTIYGGGGLDNIVGGGGNDSLYAEGSAAAEMRGGDGDDVLNTLGTGGYKLYGGSGLDTFNLTTAVVGLTAEGADGDDVFNVAIGAGSAELSGGAGADTFILTSGQVTMRGDAGQDVFRLNASQFSLAGSYNFRITGFETGAGGDKLDLVGAVNGLTSFGGGNPFTTGHMRLLQSGADTLVQVDANGGADSFSTLFTLTGVQATAITAFNLSGYAPGSTPPPSGETRTGTAAADTLTGTSGDDTLNGQGGDDILIGGAGGDQLNGGAGVDTADYGTSSAGVTVNLTVSGAQSGGDAAGDILSGIENLGGSNFADVLTGDGLANFLKGAQGDDQLNGGGGDDVLTGGKGADTLTGGTGADRFVFAAEHSGLGSGQRDVVTDFSHAQGDLIDLSAFNGTFSFQGSAAFTGVANQIRYAASGGDTLVLGDVNGDGVADFEIRLIGSHSLVSNDFLL